MEWEDREWNWDSGGGGVAGTPLRSKCKESEEVT